MKRARALILVALPTAAFASGDPNILLWPIGIICALPLAIFLALRPALSRITRVAIILASIGAGIAPGFFHHEGPRLPPDYFIVGFVPAAVAACLVYFAFRRQRT